MKKYVHQHCISIKIFDKKPSFKYDVMYDDNGEMVVKKKKRSEWENHSTWLGQIKIGSYKRDFLMSCSIWNMEDYYRQWCEGLDRINLHSRSCLVMDVSYARGLHSVEWWFLYKIGDNIHLKYAIWLGKTYDKMIGNLPFTPDTCYNFIPERRTHEDDGEEIDELIVSCE